jgi:hypothetical protein
LRPDILEEVHSHYIDTAFIAVWGIITVDLKIL